MDWRKNFDALFIQLMKKFKECLGQLRHINLNWTVDFICFENNLLDISALWTQTGSEIKAIICILLQKLRTWQILSLIEVLNRIWFKENVYLWFMDIILEYLEVISHFSFAWILQFCTYIFYYNKWLKCVFENQISFSKVEIPLISLNKSFDTGSLGKHFPHTIPSCLFSFYNYSARV